MFRVRRFGMRATRDVLLVCPAAADASAGRISVLAPIGAALFGLRVGGRIERPLPDGRMAKIHILAVSRAAGEQTETAA